jgi:hypothetical protein
MGRLAYVVAPVALCVLMSGPAHAVSNVVTDWNAALAQIVKDFNITNQVRRDPETKSPSSIFSESEEEKEMNK